MTTASDAIAIVQSAYDRLFAGDLEGFLDALAEDCVLIEAETLPYGGTHEGREAIRAVVHQILGLFDVFRFDIADMTASNKSVIAYGTMTLRGVRTGMEIAFPLAERWTVSDGRVRQITAIYGDTARVIEAAG